MLRFRREASIHGDLFNSPEKYRVVTVNCVGAMGKGIALSCRNLHTSLYEDYRKRCRNNEIVIGKTYLYEAEQIILLPTKTHFKLPSQVEYIINGLYHLVENCQGLEGGIALPPLGMANGWLRKSDRNRVFTALNDILSPMPERYAIYLPEDLYEDAKALLQQK